MSGVRAWKYRPQPVDRVRCSAPAGKQRRRGCRTRAHASHPILFIATARDADVDRAIGCADVEVVTVDKSRLVRELLSELMPVAGNRQIEVGAAEPSPAKADRAMPRQVLSNAIRFTAQPDTAGIEVTGVTGQSIYSVRDNGAGFDPALANKLFGMFQGMHTVGWTAFPERISGSRSPAGLSASTVAGS